MQIWNLAHRGASYAAPENTLSAFLLARDMGADGIELDVQLSRDGTAVVMHDTTLDRTTNGSGAMADLTLAELKELDAGSWFASDFAGERIPTLVEVFETVGRDLLMNLELKAMGAEPTGLEEAAASLIAQHRMEEQVLISSFNPLALQRVRRADPHLPLAFLYGPRLPEAERERWVQDLRPLAALHPEHRLVDADHLAWARGHNCAVNTWTVDEPEEMQRLLVLRVEGIITDRPDLLRAILQGTGSPGAIEHG
jgi:glycerophosphoryl diester phosphodiesterase